MIGSHRATGVFVSQDSIVFSIFFLKKVCTLPLNLFYEYPLWLPAVRAAPLTTLLLSEVKELKMDTSTFPILTHLSPGLFFRPVYGRR